MSQAELAKLLGVTTASTSNWCTGKKTPRMDKVDKICKIFNCKRSDLLEEKTQSSVTIPHISPTEHLVLDSYRSADDITKTMVHRTLGIEDKVKSTAASEDVMEPTTEDLETEYKKNVLGSVSEKESTALSSIGDKEAVNE